MPSVVRDVINGWVSWGAWNVGLLSFDHSLFDGADVFGVSPLDASFGGTYDDVSALLDHIVITRGRNDNVTTMLAGQATVDIRDPDGLFNPDNAGTLVNLCTDPSFELGTAGWALSGPATIAQSAAIAKFGSKSLRIVATAAFGGAYLPAFIPVTPSTAYTLSVYVAPDAGGTPIRIRWDEYTAGSVFVATRQVTITPSVGWQRVLVTAVTDPTTFFVQPVIDSPTAAQGFFIDGVQFEAGAAATVYCDGDQPGCKWSGAAHGSTSIRGGVLYGQLEDRLHPIKLQSTYSTVKYPRFYGWVDQLTWEPSGRRGITQLHCIDLFYWLDRAMPVIASTGPTTTGAAIGKVLDSIGATDIAMRDLDVGDAIPDFSADGSISGLQIIANLLDAERGVFFVAGTGKGTYRSRLSRLTKTSSATITDHMNAMANGVDFNQAQTRVTVTRTQDSYKSIATADAVTLGKIGYVDAPEISTAYLNSDAQADQLAAWVLSQVKTPRPPMYDFAIDNREDALLAQILQRELIDRITVHAARGGTIGDYYIDSLTETIDRATASHTAEWLLSRASAVAPIIFDTSTFDSGAVFVY